MGEFLSTRHSLPCQTRVQQISHLECNQSENGAYQYHQREAMQLPNHMVLPILTLNTHDTRAPQVHHILWYQDCQYPSPFSQEVDKKQVSSTSILGVEIMSKFKLYNEQIQPCPLLPLLRYVWSFILFKILLLNYIFCLLLKKIEI
jgi:hypothetical protein